MTVDNKRDVQKQFGDHAAAYVTSKTHAQGSSLARLTEIIAPKANWLVLDIATGGGHTALQFSGYVRKAIASDLTHPMLQTARTFIEETKGVRNVSFAQHDAEALPYPDNTFDVVTSRIAPHHFPQVEHFVAEAARVLKPGGVFGLVDNVVSGERAVGEYVNAFEKLRDPSHFEAYSVDDWTTFMFKQGLTVFHEEMYFKTMDFDPWSTRLGINDEDLKRLRVLLLQAPDDVKAWMEPANTDGKLTFKIAEAIICARKSR